MEINTIIDIRSLTNMSIKTTQGVLWHMELKTTKGVLNMHNQKNM
jgi:hypothetical protein